MSQREQLVQSAVSFLRDPSAASSSLTQRIQFLESKGLSPPEIQTALRLADGSGPGPAPLSPYAAPPPAQYERDWRDWFIMSVVGGSIGFLGYKLYEKFISPNLQPPSDTDLEAAQKALEEKYDQASAAVHELQQSTDALHQALEDQRQAVDFEIGQVRQAIQQVQDGELRRKKWADDIDAELRTLLSDIPAMTDRVDQSQANALSALKSELTSIKSLVLSRIAQPTPADQAPKPDIANGAQNGQAPKPKVSLPSWQLRAPKDEKAQSPAQPSPAQSQPEQSSSTLNPESKPESQVAAS